MIIPQWSTQGWRGNLAALLAGVLLPLSLAPYDVWFIGVLSATTLAILLNRLNGKQGLIRALAYGAGMYGAGASWVYVSIHDFGYTSAPLALVLTSLFVLGLALVFAIPFYLYCRFLSRTRLGFVLGFAATWLLGEWSRSWFLTGFPWLYLGYGHLDTWLSGWGPILGVFGLSFCAIFSGTTIAILSELALKKLRFPTQQTVTTSPIKIGILALPLAAVWGGGFFLQNKSWTHYSDADALDIAIIQPNIPMEEKWNPLYRHAILENLRDLSTEHWEKDMIVWPEAAIPLMYHEAEDLFNDIETISQETDTAFITGILYDDKTPDVYYNSVVGLGNAEGIYFKQRLVPFGEYVPLEKYLRGLIAFFDLPNSIIFAGPAKQEGLKTPSYRIGAYICYEVVYPGLVAETAREAGVLITISNDAWFGKSIGPLQHFQIARMRALETGRYLIRGTNTGVSGIIDSHGKVVNMIPQFERTSLSGTIYRTHDTTPFVKFSSYPILLFSILSVIIAGLIQYREKSKKPDAC